MDLYLFALLFLVGFLWYYVKKPSNDTHVAPLTPRHQEDDRAEIVREEDSSLRQRTVKASEHTTQHTSAPKEQVVNEEKDIKKMDTPAEEAPASPVEDVAESEPKQEEVKENQEEKEEPAQDDEEEVDETEEFDEEFDEDGFDTEEEDENEGDLTEVTSSAKARTFIAAVASLQGMRPRNEDRFVIDTESFSNASVFAVFDGHDGPAASEFCMYSSIMVLWLTAWCRLKAFGEGDKVQQILPQEYQTYPV